MLAPDGSHLVAFVLDGRHLWKILLELLEVRLERQCPRWRGLTLVFNGGFDSDCKSVGIIMRLVVQS